MKRVIHLVATAALPTAALAQLPPAPVPGILPQHALFCRALPIPDHVERHEIGSLAAWRDRLWVATMVEQTDDRPSADLLSLDPSLSLAAAGNAAGSSSSRGRLLHLPSNQVFLGSFAIGATGAPRPLHRLRERNVAAFAEHLTKPTSMIYALAVDGTLLTVDTQSLLATEVADAAQAIGIAAEDAHFTAAHTADGKVLLAHAGAPDAPGLIEWDGSAFRVLEHGRFAAIDSAATPSGRRAVVALGWTSAAVALRVQHGGQWFRGTLPSTHAPDPGQPSLLLREIAGGTHLVVAGGHFYHLTLSEDATPMPRLRPIGNHVLPVHDLCSYAGMLAVAFGGVRASAGQPQTNLWLGRADDLGDPAPCSAGIWHRADLAAGAQSDPVSLTGFQPQSVLVAAADQSGVVHVEIDASGAGDWLTFATMQVDGGATLSFPAGFAAHWLRLRTEDALTLSAWVHCR